jgi:hypothetical protein
MRIVLPAAEGLSNRQIASQMFLSVHTIAFHLRRVFCKLDITSRVQLAGLAARPPRPDLILGGGVLRGRESSGCTEPGLEADSPAARPMGDVAVRFVRYGDVSARTRPSLY